MNTISYTPAELAKMSEQELGSLPYSIAKIEMDRRANEEQNLRDMYKELTQISTKKAITTLLEASEYLRVLKGMIYNMFRESFSMKAEAYKIKDGQMSHTFADEDGNTVRLGFNVIDKWDDTHTAGVQKIEQELQSMSKDEDTAFLVKAIMSLLQQNKKGDLKLNRVLELEKLALESGRENLIDGVKIILDSHKLERTSWFVSGYIKTAEGNKHIPLSLSGVDFPDGFDTNFFN